MRPHADRLGGSLTPPPPSLTPGIFHSSRCTILEIPSQARISWRLQPILIPAVEFLRRPCQECLFFRLFRVPERQREEEAPWRFHACDSLLHTCTLEAKAAELAAAELGLSSSGLDPLPGAGKRGGERGPSAPDTLPPPLDPPHLPPSQIFCPVRPGATSGRSTFVVLASSMMPGPQRVR